MRHIFPFDHPHRIAPNELRRLLGGKGFGLFQMTSDLNLPVPPGFTITTDACREYLLSGWPAGLEEQLRSHLDQLESVMGRRLGDPADPLLVSVRSGAAASMPGMMDTILNLGLTPVSVLGLATVTDDAGFAEDCHRRFTEMFRSTVGVDEVPDDPWQQLRLAVEAVFRSWNSPRAVAYRDHEGIDHQLGTAVSIQAMVFGNSGERSATGVMFTRNPATGERSVYGDVLFGAQGEDVVSGTSQTLPLHDLGKRLPDLGDQLRRFAEILEHHQRDLCDIEFTIERGKLWMLQVRVGKRTPQAAVRIALDMAEDDQFPLTMAEAIERVKGHLRDLPSRSVKRPASIPSLTCGLGASPGVVSGEIAITAEEAARVASLGRPVVLVRPETSPADVHGMTHAAGILTATGGLVSHAAVVARGWGIPAVVGAHEVTFGEDVVRVGDTTLRVGETITIDGATGEVFAGTVSGKSETIPEALTLLRWAAELGVEISDDSREPATQPDQPMSTISDDDVIGVIAVKGFVSADSVAKATMSDPDRAATILDRLTTDGLTEAAGPMLRLTDAGNAAAARILVEEQATLGDDVTHMALDSFLPLDHRAKTIITRWQLVEEANGVRVPNDHTDPKYDEAVIKDLSTLTEDVASWIDPLAIDLPRLQRYLVRLGTAMEHIGNDDHRYFASPIVDSFHSIWFEIHEDLIRLAGSTRADETAAGRA